MSERKSYFTYSASGSAFGGALTMPDLRTVPSGAMASLSPSGGYGTSCVENFGMDGLLTVRKAITTAQGDPKQTELTVTLEGVNLLNVLTLDRLVLHLVSQPDPFGREAAITPAGSVIDGLRVYGRLLELKSSVEVFDRFSTYSSLEKAYGEGLLNGLIIEPGTLGTPCSSKDLGGCVTPMGDLKATLYAASGFPDWLPVVNGGLRVKDFATLYFGEYRVSKFARRLTMLRVELGCDRFGSMSFADGVGNGHEEPPA